MINRYIQGNPDTDPLLFATLGATTTNADIHKTLGMAITSRQDDIWYLDTGKDGQLHGFALLRPLKNGKTAHLRFLYAPLKTAQKRLLKAVLKATLSMGLKSIHTNDKASNPLWRDNGFTLITSNRRGHYVRWHKTLEHPTS